MNDFRDLMDQWDDYSESKDLVDKLKLITDGGKLILFIVKDDKIYGGPEDSRITFARMKNPSDEEPEGWLKDAYFMGFDLLKLLKGEKDQVLFGVDDLDNIEAIDKDDVPSMLIPQIKQDNEKSKIIEKLTKMQKASEPMVPPHLNPIKIRFK